jgi:hypothetical protein
MQWNWYKQCLRRTMKEARNDLPKEMRRATEDDMHAAEDVVSATLAVASIILAQRVPRLTEKRFCGLLQ